MKGYKGFEPGLICKGKQYAENTVFEEEKGEKKEEEEEVKKESEKESREKK